MRQRTNDSNLPRSLGRLVGRLLQAAMPVVDGLTLEIDGHEVERSLRDRSKRRTAEASERRWPLAA